MATQEDPKLTSSHRHTEFRATYGQVFLLRKPKVRLSGKQETTRSPHSLPQPEETQNPGFLPKHDDPQHYSQGQGEDETRQTQCPLRREAPI